ncbi:ATP synthase F0 subunit C [Lujinxingia vulgaris]|uniref:ATP synthase subunit c n=1 Tax=Lujinxingia vulgaris TaxID=2600176 RepID=A0A5C6XNJ8_9DELT|nr:ATP synthase F0 subunit C [Lujinxingia vulgaris]TXD43502.1 ATP synthase F0 subunit C [Lujinxingia vulgaris]
MLKKSTITFLSTFAIVALWSTSAFAQGTAAAADNVFTTYAWLGAAAAFGVGLAALGGSLGQGRAASAALEGIARNPGAAGKLFTPLILGLALIESLVIYAFVISILMVLNIDITAAL